MKSSGSSSQSSGGKQEAAAGKGEKSFYERRWFKATAAVLTLAGTFWAFIGAPSPWSWLDDQLSDEPSLSNTEIVLDASVGMRAPYKGGTKFDAAVEAIADYVVPLDDEALALRRTGGGCGKPGELLVDFGTNQGDEVRKAAAAQAPEGAPNLAYTILAALDDFSDSDRFGDPEMRNRVLVVTGPEADACLSDATRRIRREVARSDVDAVLSLIAVTASPQERANVLELANALDPSRSAPASTSKQPVAAVPSACARPNVECAYAAPPPPAAASPPPAGFVEPETSVAGEEVHRVDTTSAQEPSGSLSVKVHFPDSKRDLARVIAKEREANAPNR